MWNNYPFSEWTPDWDALESLSSEQRVAVLQSNWVTVYDEANKINEKFNKVLDNNKKLEWLKILNHPKAKSLYDFVISSEENQNWYLENSDKIKLLEDWIEILWDEFYLEDEIAEENWSSIWNDNWNTYFSTNSGKNYANSQWKWIPTDWPKYTDFLPWSDINKSKFLTDVLWLKYAGFRNWNNGRFYHQSTDAHYLSGKTPNSEHSYNLHFNDTAILTADPDMKSWAFILRCIKIK